MRRTSIALAIALVGTAPTVRAQGSADFSWDGRLAPGRTLYVRSINGPIRVERATGNKAEVTAVKRARRDDPNEVKITVKRVGGDDGDVVICALWDEDAQCDERGYRSEHHEGWRGRSNDTEVRFTVRLPEGVNIQASTVNGDVRVGGATARVIASTVNGGVEALSSGGPVRASTVNGDVDVRMGRLGDSDEDLRYSTVNGSIRVEVPTPFDADVEMSTVNGSLSADFPITLQGRMNPRHIRATIGRGGRLVRFTTVNGSVELRKGT